MSVTSVDLQLAFAAVASNDVLGWACVVVNGKHRLSELPIGRAAHGQLVVLAWPQQSASRQHQKFIYELDLESRVEIERQIITALPIKRGIAG
ncbi:MAG: hypothetical protein HYR85_20015 [Planctomycetes bacterium]|nr:hypothetical protein [Planctomycetota bacterium]MBI3844516.1 hypothetical protein [Planctomycetota bacterium]